MKILNANTILSLLILLVLSFGAFILYQEANEDLDAFDFEQPVPVVTDKVPLDGYLSIIATRCRYVEGSSFITRRLDYTNGVQIQIATDDDPDIKRYQPNCLDERGNRIPLDEARPEPVAATIFIPSSVRRDTTTEPVLTGCGVVLVSTIFTQPSLLQEPKEYEYRTEPFCIVPPKRPSGELLSDVDVLIERTK